MAVHGTLIVFEGTDGSGKSTQFSLAKAWLVNRGIKILSCTYPQYASDSSALVRMYLGGQFGSHPSDVNAYAASSFYAVDRYAGYKTVWGDFYENGGMVILDRYTTSNAIHQASKLPEEEREPFLRWLEDYEYRLLGLPRPDLVIWLDMPVEMAVSNLRHRESATNTTADIHEADVAYLTQCRAAAAQAAALYGWQRINCVAEDGSLRSTRDIHEEIAAILERLKKEF